MPEQLDLTVVVPTYNNDEWIEGCLESLARQKLANSRFEVIVVPNGPRTQAADIVRDFAARHPRLQLRVIEAETAGLCHARNVGIDAARGQYVAFVDVDDRVGPRHLSALLDVAGPDVIGATLVAAVRDGNFRKPRFDSYHSAGLREFMSQDVHGRELIVLLTYPWAKVVSTERARAVRFNESVNHSEDVLFWSEVVARFPTTFRLGSTRMNAAYLYNIRSGSMMNHDAQPSWDKNVTRQLDVLRALEKITAPDPATEWMIREAEARHWGGEVWPFFRARPRQIPRLAEVVAENGLRNVPWRGLGLKEIPYAPGMYPPVEVEPRRKFLAIIRCGPSSLHPHMVKRLQEQNFDFALSWFGAEDPDDLEMADGAVFVHRVKGAKWPGLYETINAYRDVIDGYDYVWLPDDDLLCVPELVSQMFATAANHEADLAQPALDRPSYWSYAITLRHPRFKVRNTTFVEVMAPIFRTAFLWEVLPTFAKSESGWGLDFVWPTMTTPDKMLIIDDTPVQHTRPIGGPNYAAAKKLGGMTPDEELEWVAAEHNIRDLKSRIITVGGTLYNGERVSIDEGTDSAIRMIDGIASSWAPWDIRNRPRVAEYLKTTVDAVAAHTETDLAAHEDEWFFRTSHSVKGLLRGGLLGAIQVLLLLLWRRFSRTAASVRFRLKHWARRAILITLNLFGFSKVRRYLAGKYNDVRAAVIATQSDVKDLKHRAAVHRGQIAGLQADIDELQTFIRDRQESLEGFLWSAYDKNIEAERQRQALRTSAQFVDEHLTNVRGLGGTWDEVSMDILRLAVGAAPTDGLALEFGVATGRTLREIVRLRGHAHGFDSFEGLPEDWRYGFDAGTFRQDAPDVPGADLHVGWFDDSLPGFLEQHPGPFAFVHMDADLYSSTNTVFTLAFDRFVPGTVILFDEYFNYPGWQQHEHKAFGEFLERYAGGFEYLAYAATHEQVAVRLT